MCVNLYKLLYKDVYVLGWIRARLGFRRARDYNQQDRPGTLEAYSLFPSEDGRGSDMHAPVSLL